MSDHQYLQKSINLTEFYVSERCIKYEDEPQLRLSFKYCGQYYNLQIVDQAIIQEYAKNEYLFYGVSEIEVSFAEANSSHVLPVKQVERIIVTDEIEFQYSESDFDELPF